MLGSVENVTEYHPESLVDIVLETLLTPLETIVLVSQSTMTILKRLLVPPAAAR